MGVNLIPPSPQVLCRPTVDHFSGRYSRMRSSTHNVSGWGALGAKSCRDVQNGASPWTDETYPANMMIESTSHRWTSSDNCANSCEMNTACNAWSWQQQTSSIGICRLYDKFNSIGQRTDGGTWSFALCAGSALPAQSETVESGIPVGIGEPVPRFGSSGVRSAEFCS